MSALRSALDEWISEDVDEIETDQLADDLVELELVSGLIDAIRVRRIEEFDRRGGHRFHGYPSMTAFLKDRCRMASGRAHRLVAAARATRIAPGLFRSWLAGRISVDQAHRLLETASAVPDEFEEFEEKLVETVEGLSHSDTRRLLEYWRQAVDGPGTTVDELGQQELRGISASVGMSGMVRVDGWMTPVAGQTLITSLDALMPPPSPYDDRTPRQRRHDALEDLVREFIDHGDTPIVGGEGPHLSVVCDIPAGHCRRASRDGEGSGSHHQRAPCHHLRLVGEPDRARAALRGHLRGEADPDHPRCIATGCHRSRPALHLAPV